MLATQIEWDADTSADDTQIVRAILDPEFGEYVYTNAVRVSFEVTDVEVGEYRPRIAEFSNMRAETVNGETFVKGYVESISEREYTFMVIIGAYDRDGNLIGIADGIIDDLGVGEKREFSIRGLHGDVISAYSFRGN